MSIAPPPPLTIPEAPDADAYRAPATDLLALLAMLASVAGVTLLPVLGSLGGMVLGAIALGRTAAQDVGGRPLALGGLVLGIAGLIVGIAITVVAVIGVSGLVTSMATMTGR